MRVDSPAFNPLQILGQNRKLIPKKQNTRSGANSRSRIRPRRPAARCLASGVGVAAEESPQKMALFACASYTSRAGGVRRFVWKHHEYQRQRQRAVPFCCGETRGRKTGAQRFPIVCSCGVSLSLSLSSWAPAAAHAHIHSITFVRYFPRNTKGNCFLMPYTQRAGERESERETTQRNRKSSYRPVSACAPKTSTDASAKGK